AGLSGTERDAAPEPVARWNVPLPSVDRLTQGVDADNERENAKADQDKPTNGVFKGMAAGGVATAPVPAPATEPVAPQAADKRSGGVAARMMKKADGGSGRRMPQAEPQGRAKEKAADGKPLAQLRMRDGDL